MKQSLAVTFTPQEKGIIRAKVCLAKASTTMYFDPKIITGARQYMTESGVQNEPASGGATGGSYTFGQ